MKRLLHIAGSMTAYKDMNGIIYFNGNYTNEVWERFYDIAEIVVVMCKLDKHVYLPDEAKIKFKAAPTENFEVVFVNDLYKSVKTFGNSPERKENEEILNREIELADGVDVKNLGFVSLEYFLKAINQYKKKYLYECIGDAWDAMWNHGLSGKILAPKAFIDQKRLASNADMVLYVTERFLQKRYPTQAPSIGISDVSIPECQDSVLIQRINHIKTMNSSKIVIGTTAGIDVPYKGQEYVIRALSHLKRQGITCFEYQMVGGGSSEKLRQIAEKEDVAELIKFIGPRSHEEVIKWLASIDIYIQPSLQEGLPRALAEAMSTAAPAIGSRTGGIPELLSERCIFEKKNYVQLANLLKSFLSKKRLMIEARSNFNYIKKYDCNVMDDKRMKFYRQFDILCRK